jgi:translation initiation factor 4B
VLAVVRQSAKPPGILSPTCRRADILGFPGAPPSREELPLPTVPPFTAFVGNLTFETDEEELRSFFGDLEPTSVRLVKDATGKPKGFGYVEFPSQDKLKGALDRSMSQLGGRTVRVSVADARESLFDHRVDPCVRLSVGTEPPRSG